jgi:choline dehydrogenase-like flavoprotein
MDGGNFWDGGPVFGSAWKKQARELFSHTVNVYGHTSTLPVATNRVDLDPKLVDAWGLPAPRLTFKEHPADVKLTVWFRDRGKELLHAAGALKVDSGGAYAGAGGPHLLGTCRMGNDPKTSVVDANHRAHDVPNLYVVDGSNFVTSGRGQPTMTIQALAFRAAALMTRQA